MPREAKPKPAWEAQPCTSSVAIATTPTSMLNSFSYIDSIYWVLMCDNEIYEMRFLVFFWPNIYSSIENMELYFVDYENNS